MKILLSISMLWAHFANILCVGRGRERKFYSVSYETEFDVIVFSFQDGACSFPPSEVGANDQGVLLLVVSSRDAREGKIKSVTSGCKTSHKKSAGIANWTSIKLYSTFTSSILIKGGVRSKPANPNTNDDSQDIATRSQNTSFTTNVCRYTQSRNRYMVEF